MTNTVKLSLLLAAVLQLPGCVATRAPHEPYEPPIVEPLLYQPEPDKIYTAGAVSPEIFGGDLVAASVDVE